MFHLALSQNGFEDNAQTTRDYQQQAQSDPFWHSIQIFSVLLLPFFVFVVSPMSNMQARTIRHWADERNLRQLQETATQILLPDFMI